MLRSPSGSYSLKLEAPLLDGEDRNRNGVTDEEVKVPLLASSSSFHTHITTGDGVSFFKALLNGINVLAGVGILSTPYAVSQGGWLSLCILFLAATVCCYTGILLQRCMEAAEENSSNAVQLYPDIGEAAFGKKGRFIICTFLYTELYAYAVAFFIMEGDNLAQLFPEGSQNFDFGRLSLTLNQTLVLLSSLIIMPTVWLKDLKFLAYVSAFGVTSCIVQLFAATWAGLTDKVEECHSEKLINFGGLPVAIGLYMVCFGGHAVFPSIYTSMEDKRKFPQVISISFALCTLMYASMGAIGYVLYGSHVQSQITLNLPRDAFASKLAILATVITPVAKYSVTVNPLAVGLEDIMYSWFPTTSRACQTIISLAIRTFLVLSTSAVAVAVPIFAYLMSLSGSFLSCSISIILPCCCYMKICGTKISIGHLMLLILVVSSGVIAAIVGTYSSLQNILKNTL